MHNHIHIQEVESHMQTNKSNTTKIVELIGHSCSGQISTESFNLRLNDSGMKLDVLQEPANHSRDNILCGAEAFGGQTTSR